MFWKRAISVPAAPIMGKILKIGIPVAFQDGLIQIAFIVITIIANQRGLNDAAAVGIVEKVISFLFLVPSSMLSTVSALGAQNIGAGKQERAVCVIYLDVSVYIFQRAVHVARLPSFSMVLLYRRIREIKRTYCAAVTRSAGGTYAS